MVVAMAIIITTVAFATTKQGFKLGDSPRGCSTTKYLAYPEDGPTEKNLFILTWNITTSNCRGLGNLPIPKGFSTSIKLDGIYNDSGGHRMYAYAVVDLRGKRIIVAFTGTETMDEIVDDVDYVQIPPDPKVLRFAPSGSLVHAGFYSVYEQIVVQLRTIVTPGHELWICGYSLGGGLAQICALDWLDLKPRLLTFASPRALNQIAATAIDDHISSIRVLNTEDVVPDLPLPIMSDPYDWTNYYYYVHTKTHRSFTTNLDSFLANHSTAYRRYYGV